MLGLYHLVTCQATVYDGKMETKSMLGKWDKWYKNLKGRTSFRYGNTVTYQRGADFLSDMEEVEDWGCGAGNFKKLYKGKYTGLDGSHNPYVDKVVDLCDYQSSVDGIMMRHVLEHNDNWRLVLRNAVASFNKKFCLVLFTPFVEHTHQITHNEKHGVDVPDISFFHGDIEDYFHGLKWRLEKNIPTKTGYNLEHVYYVEKP